MNPRLQAMWSGSFLSKNSPASPLMSAAPVLMYLQSVCQQSVSALTAALFKTTARGECSRLWIALTACKK